MIFKSFYQDFSKYTKKTKIKKYV